MTYTFSMLIVIRCVCCLSQYKGVCMKENDQWNRIRFAYHASRIVSVITKCRKSK